LAGHATQQGGLAAAVGGDKADPVSGIDDEIEFENSGAPRLTPRLRMVMSVMIVLPVLPRSRHPGHAAFVGCR
jgi:hypothetical protein